MIGCKNSAIVRDWLRLSENATPSSGGKCPHPVPGAPGSGGKCTKFAAIWFTFPGKKGEMAVKSTFSAGKCTKKSGKMVHFPPPAKCRHFSGKQKEGRGNFADINIFPPAFIYQIKILTTHSS